MVRKNINQVIAGLSKGRQNKINARAAELISEEITRKPQGGTMSKEMKKLWGIRHIRWYWLSWKLQKHIEQCQRHGIGFYAQQSDFDYLDAVLRGEK